MIVLMSCQPSSTLNSEMISASAGTICTSRIGDDERLAAAEPEARHARPPPGRR